MTDLGTHAAFLAADFATARSTATATHSDLRFEVLLFGGLLRDAIIEFALVATSAHFERQAPFRSPNIGVNGTNYE